MFEYKCEIRRVVDGDTVDIDVDLGFGVWLRDERVRIVGIDTPEKRTSDPNEKVFGLLASKRVEELLPVDSTHTLVSKEFKGKFGRILGDIIVDQHKILLSEMLISEHLAVPYFGQAKELIEDAHLQNRDNLLGMGKVQCDEEGQYTAV